MSVILIYLNKNVETSGKDICILHVFTALINNGRQAFFFTLPATKFPNKRINWSTGWTS